MIGTEEEARSYMAELTDASGFERLSRFATLLAAENGRQNLVSAATLDTVWQRHFADSAQLLRHVPRETSDILDLGTGAGFPGVVLALLRPETHVVCVESRAKRVEWLAQLVETLNLPNCHIAGQRLETLAPSSAAIITARAFAPLRRLLAVAGRFSTPDTVWLLPKGRRAAQEWAELPKRERALFHVEQSMTDPDAGIIVGRYAPKERHRA